MDELLHDVPEFFDYEEEPTHEGCSGKPVIAQSHRDDRRCPRNVVPTFHQPCRLKVGPKDWPASLMNESQGGFAVLVDRIEHLKVGMKAELLTNMERFMVRIVYISEVVRPKSSDHKDGTCFRIGMKIKRRLQPPPQSPTLPALT